jgi:hypothetical protein
VRRPIVRALHLISLVSCLALFITPAVCSQPSPPPASPGHPDDYQVIMWVLGGYTDDTDLFFQRLRDANITAVQINPGMSPDPAVSRGLGYYIENVHRIAFLHDRRPIYQADWDGYTSTHDKRFLLRDPCLHDPEYLAQAKHDIQTDVSHHADAEPRPLLYDLGDECSITSFASPMDYCFSDLTLAAFRRWLRDQYPSLRRLNDQWETDFPTWDDLLPMTTYEIKERESAGLSPAPPLDADASEQAAPAPEPTTDRSARPSRPADRENYSPWADHRTFMDITFAQSWRQFRQWVREVDPHTPVGLEGTQMPAAFGGYDLWRLSQVLDWVEPYDVGNAHAIWRSFFPETAPIYATLFEHDPNHASRRLWHLVLNGDRGVIIWCSKDWFDYESPDLAPQPFVSGMADLFAQLRGPAAHTIMHAHRDRAPIAIHYSHPSLQVAWMLDSREDGDTWPRRFSSWEATHSRLTLVRNSWTKLIEDLGLQYDFVSTQQILDGVLEQRGYQALILPQSMAIGDDEASAIKAYVRAGGAVIADFLPGVFDEHARRRSSGVLDGLFGVGRFRSGLINQPQQTEGPGFVLDGRHLPLGPAEPHLRLLVGRPAAYTAPLSLDEPAAGAPDRTPVLIQRRVGAGRTCYLNLSPIDYAKWRLSGDGADLRRIIAGIFADIGIQPPIAVTIEGGPPVGCEVVTYRGDDGRRYLALMRNPEYRISSLGEIGYTDNSRFETPVEVTITLDQPTQLREMLSDRDLGEAERLTLTLDPWKPILFQFH